MVKEYVYLYVEDDPLSREALSIIFTRVMKVKQLYILEDSTDFMARDQRPARYPGPDHPGYSREAAERVRDAATAAAGPAVSALPDHCADGQRDERGSQPAANERF